MGSIVRPTREECLAFDGAHCHAIWASLPETWRCPACDRTKFETVRWTRRKRRSPPYEHYMDWLASFHGHHDHGVDADTFDADGMWIPRSAPRFPETIICDQCNSADGSAKRRLGLPSDWSFSPAEIGEFITATAHGKHRIDLPAAKAIYTEYSGRTRAAGMPTGRHPSRN